MKKIFYSILLLFIFSSLACKNKSENKSKEEKLANSIAQEIIPPSEAIKGESIYQLTSVFKDQESKETRLGVYEGYPVLISMFYASCPYSCPVLIDRLKMFEKKLDEKMKSNLRVLLVSFDPENDTPEALKKLLQKHNLDASRWKLLTGDENQIREVAAVLGIQYRKNPEGGFNHSSLITVLDAQGKIKNQYETVKFGAEEAKKDF